MHYNKSHSTDTDIFLALLQISLWPIWPGLSSPTHCYSIDQQEVYYQKLVSHLHCLIKAMIIMMCLYSSKMLMTCKILVNTSHFSQQDQLQQYNMSIATSGMHETLVWYGNDDHYGRSSKICFTRTGQFIMRTKRHVKPYHSWRILKVAKTFNELVNTWTAIYKIQDPRDQM